MEEHIETWQTLEKKNDDYEIPNQVRLAAIGPTIDESIYYVEYQDISFNFKSILEAFEFALQIHILFHIEYQKQSHYFWQLLQNCFYNREIPNSGTLKEINISNFVAEIKNAAKSI